jgi:Flp pilus assembly protein TadG
MAQVKRLLDKLRRSESGAELIEFAISLPVLLLIVGGIVEFSILFQEYQVVTNAAREGARVAVLPDFNVADVQNRVDSYLKASGLKDSYPATAVTYNSVTVTPGGPSVSVVKVLVKYPHNYVMLSPLSTMVGGSSYSQTMLAAASVMRREVAATP